MLAHYCKGCKMYYRELELVKGRCPECLEPVKPRLVLGGQVMGAVEEATWIT